MFRRTAPASQPMVRCSGISKRLSDAFFAANFAFRERLLKNFAEDPFAI
jgi:hypothetical protein